MQTKVLVTVLFAVFLAQAFVVMPVLGQGSAQSAIESTKRDLKNSYDAVATAESKGANVDALVVTLNEAASLLSNAELSYASGDDSSAYNFAIQSQSKLGGIANAANNLATAAQANNQQNQIATIILALFASVVLCAGIVSWVILGRDKRRSDYGAPAI